MIRKILAIITLFAVCSALVMLVNPVLAQNGDPLINEFVFNHTGSDTEAFIEVLGDPSTDYSAYTVLEIEGDTTAPGVIDAVLPVGTTDAAGYWVDDEDAENGTVTLLLVTGFSGSAGDDLDTDDDGVLDSTPWTGLVDDIAVTDGGSGDQTYASTVLVPGFDGNTFSAGGASRIPNGTDTDSVADWMRNDFDGAGFPVFPGTPEVGEALNTPGADNEAITGPPPPPPPSEERVTIMEIQGSGQFSPYAGMQVETSGVVTLLNSNGTDMWIQDPVGDGDPTTSDGILVDDRDDLDPMPQVGDVISITAFVEEQQFGAALPRTRLNNPVPALTVILSSGNPLPAPVSITDLPNEVLTDGIDFWEPLEGMLVNVRASLVVAATNGFGEFGVVSKPDSVPGSGYFPSVKQLLLQYDEASDTVDYNPERIMVDDSAADTPSVRPGNFVRDMLGVVDYTFSNYKLQLSSIGSIASRPMPTPPVSKRSGGRGNLIVTSYNVENLFDLEDNPDKADEGSTPTPEELETQLAKLALAIELELVLPEIIVVQEVENTEILQELGDLVNAAAGTNYSATSFETSDVRGIEVGFLWDADRVSLLDAFQMSGPDVEEAFGDSSPSPGREPLVGVFRVSENFQDPLLTIIGNHFKSKGGDDPLYGVNQPPIRITEVQRKLQAQVVRDFANGILDADPDALVMVTGDLNDFQFPEPGEGADHPLGILAGMGSEVPLINLVEMEKEAERFTFVFDGNSQVLDHMLVSPALLDYKVGQDILHFNTPYPASLESDPTSPLSASDHDAVEGRFLFGKVRSTFNLTVLHNNDGESALIDRGSGLEDFGGAARFKTVLDNLRGGTSFQVYRGASLLVSSGDNFLAGPEFAASLENGVPFYDTIAMDLFDYDAVAIGNHDFDFNPDVLADFIEGYQMNLAPYLSSNLIFDAEPRLQALFAAGRIARSTVVMAGNEPIGIIGAITPNLPFISSPRDVVVLEDVAGAVQAEVDALEAMGVDKIILISHLQDIDEDVELAAEVRGIDVMVAGGGDELLANPGDLLIPDDFDDDGNPLYPTPFGVYPQVAVGMDGNHIPVVTTEGSYGYVGKLVVGFDADGNLIKVEDDQSGPVRVAGGSNPDAVAPDPVVQALVTDPVAAYLAELANNVIGTSEVDLDGRRNAVRSVESNEGNLIADALKWQATELAADFGVPAPDVALQNGGRIRNDTIIAAGDITELDTFSMVPFPNFLTVFPAIPRAQFKEILENAVSNVNDPPPDPPGGSGRFAQVAGFSFEWDQAGTAQELDEDGNVTVPGTKVRNLVLDNGDVIVDAAGNVVPGADLTVATIDFLARGGDQYPFRTAPFTVLGVSYQQALVNYIQDAGALNGVITAADYPEGGEGRITRIN